MQNSNERLSAFSQLHDFKKEEEMGLLLRPVPGKCSGGPYRDILTLCFKVYYIKDTVRYQSKEYLGCSFSSSKCAFAALDRSCKYWVWTLWLTVDFVGYGECLPLGGWPFLQYACYTALFWTPVWVMYASQMGMPSNCLGIIGSCL